MKNIIKVILLTDSSNDATGYYQVFFDDQSTENTSLEMNIKLFNKVQEWLKTNNAEYDIDNLCLKTKQQIENKIEELYKKAQIVKVINGITFYYPIFGDEYLIFKGKVQEARDLDYCSIIIKGIDDISYSAFPPYNLMNRIYKEMDDIDTINSRIKIQLNQAMERYFKNKNINSMNKLNLNIFKTNSIINLNEICDKILEASPEDKYLNKIKFIENGKNRYHIFTELTNIF